MASVKLMTTTEVEAMIEREDMLKARLRAQRARLPDDPVKLLQATNTRRLEVGLRPLKPKVERYPGLYLRAIRARAVNFHGEAQR